MKKVEKKHGRRYTEAELIYLESSWGNVSVQKIAITLGRSIKAVEVKAGRMGLGNPLNRRDFLIAIEVEQLLGIDRNTLQKHLKNRGLKYKERTLKNRKLVTVTYDDLVEWLEENQKHWNGNKVDKLGLISIGLSEKTLYEKCEKDRIEEQRKTFTKKEIVRLKEMYKQFITYEGIALALNKEFATVKWKIHTLIKNGELERNIDNNRLVRVTNREKYGWSKWQDEILITEFRNGKTLREISKMVGKSLSTTKSRNQVLTRRMMKGLAI